MQPLLYRDLVPWYRLLDPVADHAEEAAAYAAALASAGAPPAGTLLELGAGAGGGALRCLEWAWDPDPRDDSYVVEYAFLLRQGDDMRAVHDRRVEGLFARATWLEILSDAGYRVELVDRPFDDTTTDSVFLC